MQRRYRASPGRRRHRSPLWVPPPPGTPPPPANFTLPGPAVPGQAVPGVFDPGYPGVTAPPAAMWTFTGPEYGLTYLQYLGPDGHVLSPSPGQAYTAGTIMVASGQAEMLQDPPADGRWITS